MADRYKPKRRIMREFTISELSAVDHPAQAPAKMAIMKRAEGEAFNKLEVVEAIAKRYLDPQEGACSFAEVVQNNMEEKRFYAIMDQVCPVVHALETALKSIAGDKTLTVDAKMSMMASSTAAFLNAMQEKWPEVDMAVNKGFSGDGAGDDGSNTGDDQMSAAEKKQLDELQKANDELTKKLETLTKQLDAAKEAGEDASKAAEATAQLEELTTKVEDLTKQVEAAEAAKADVQAKADMSDDEREYMAGLDKEKQAAFTGMSADERRRAMKEASKNDEVVKVGDLEVRKSVVGDAQFEVIKSLQGRIDTQETDLRKEREKSETAVLTKRADDEYPLLPGTLEEKVAVLKGIQDMDEEAQEHLTKMLTAGEKALKSAFESVGHGGGDLSDMKKKSDTFMTRVNEIAKRDECTRTQAMAKARQEHPDEYAAYQDTGNSAN